MRRRDRIAIALRLRIMAIDRGIQIGHAERVGRPLDLCQIDGHTLPRQATAQQRCDHNGRPHDKAQMIGIDSLAADGTILVGMIPEIGHSGKCREIKPPGAVAALRAFRAESR